MASQKRTFGLLINDKSSADTEILIGGQQIAVLIEATEPHAVRMGFQNLIPSPEHVTIHVIRDAVMPSEEKSFVLQYAGIPRWNSSGVDGFWVGT